ncbi:WecB/TagA/CpsF family glycosyltransferase [Aeoliella sp. SH292]|uniref:WecB/TagA/CpsF family glycosyltransferase n=1 Tax=Aeoliella sp. SH292 TaxID=3454464 RepID=UPI003F948CFE
MPVVLLVAAVVLLVWSAVVFRWLSPVGVAVATVAVGYVLGHSFWNLHLGPLPVTIDRLLLGVLVVVSGWYLWQGRTCLRSLLPVDWAVLALLGWLSVSCVLFNVGAGADLPTSPFFRLLFSFWMPAAIYLCVRLAPLSHRTTTYVLAALSVLGTYLAFTACAEITEQWWAVFPKYITDPEQGTHFGRARGPALNSVSLGNYLAICLWAAWTLRSRVTRGWQLLLLGAMCLMVLGVLFTYTRSVWMGLALSGFVMLVAETPRYLRIPVAVGTTIVGGLLAVAGWSFVLELKREDSGQVSAHSVEQRTAFAYVSYHMFVDHPLVGVGFGRFYDKKLPYLTDRRQPFELESIRGLHHHNTFLGLLTETGLVGLVTYCAMLCGWIAVGCRMALGRGHTLATNQMGRLLLAALAVYLPSALFHDISLIFQDQTLLFLIAGLAVATAEQEKVAQLVPQQAIATAKPLFTPYPAATAMSTTTAPQVSLFGMKIDRVTLAEATSRVMDWCRGDVATCQYVVTPNVDHAVQLTHHDGLRQSYAGAAMVLADGAPIVAASRLLGRPLPERVAGSDLVPSVLAAAATAEKPLRVFLLGAGPGVGDRAAANIRRQYPNVEIVGTHCPPLGFENDPVANQAAIDAVNAGSPDLLVVGLGAPKQELWIAKNQKALHAKVALCAGATIDFLAGEKQRSPVWMQRVGLEWLHRLCSEPRRLAKRYARDATVFPQLVWREWRGASG